MPTLSLPQAGAVGIPEGLKETGKRVDFKPDDFTLAIETKGYRIAWSRACLCPCIPVNDQTEQPDPNCSLCDGHAWLWFKPAGAVTDNKKIGDLDALQAKIVADYDAAVIMGIMSGLTSKELNYEQVLRRLEGQAILTVRHENRLGYHDKIVNLDSMIVYSQILKADGTSTTTTRYPIAQLNLLRSEDTVYVEGTDFNVVTGDIIWEAGKEPASDARLAAHYHCHPTWVVEEHPLATRVTPVKFKTLSPVGDQRQLPIHSVIKYEFLP